MNSMKAMNGMTALNAINSMNSMNAMNGSGIGSNRMSGVSAVNAVSGGNTVNGLNGHRSPSNGVQNAQHVQNVQNSLPQTTPHEVEVFFEDETSVVVTGDVNIRAIDLIAFALEKRGYNTSMAPLFTMCVKEGNSTSADNGDRMVALEDGANPISSLSQYINGMNMVNPKLVVCYKQGAQ